MVIDPVCEMTVTEATVTAKSIYKGHTYYFCSMLCKQLFDRDPEKYFRELEHLI